MTLILKKKLPVIEFLKKENIPIENFSDFIVNGVKPLNIAILNLMPNKETTELQLLRLLDSQQFSVKVEFVYVATHKTKNTSEDYLKKHYKSFEEIKNQKWDGMIITGAPVELLEFEEVDYWTELKNIMDWAVSNVTSAFFICWGAQAALNHYYQIPKYKLSEKMFGVFYHPINHISPITNGFQNPYLAPHSRHTEVIRKDIEKISDLKIISESEEAGVYIVANEKKKQFFVTGHSEYDVNTLKDEYLRDVNKGLPINKPRNYFLNNNENIAPLKTWDEHAKLLFSNWLNYYVSPFQKQ